MGHGDTMEGQKENKTSHSESMSSESGGCVRGCLSRGHVTVPSPLAQQSLPAAPGGTESLFGHHWLQQNLIPMTEMRWQCSREQDFICAWGRILTYVGLKGVRNWKGNGV